MHSAPCCKKCLAELGSLGAISGFLICSHSVGGQEPTKKSCVSDTRQDLTRSCNPPACECGTMLTKQGTLKNSLDEESWTFLSSERVEQILLLLLLTRYTYRET